MDDLDYTAKLNSYRESVEKGLFELVSSLSGNKKLIEAIGYSLLSGGKRLRPVLFLAACDMFGGNKKKLLPFALALECVHTYSLIHDDLPAMDNDDMRRGRPSCHKRFDEAHAILAGDALLNLAFETALSNVEDMHGVQALKYLADFSGIKGMIGGQAYDLQYEKSKIKTEKMLLDIDTGKTSALLTAPLVMAAELSAKNVEPMLKLGNYLGLMFQYVDDILDEESTFEQMGKTLGKDKAADKLTAVSVFGLEGAKKRVIELKNNCLKILSELSGSEFLSKLICDMAERKS